MNTVTVSNLLGVSSSTVQRWVKHLDLQMKRNEFGHYVYSEEDVELLKDFQQQIQKGIPIQEIAVRGKARKGTAKVYRNQQAEQNIGEEWQEKIRELEARLNNKADSVVSYQIKQYRSEIEDLQKQLYKLQTEMEEFKAKQETIEEYMNDSYESRISEKTRKKNIFSAIFSS